MRYRRRGLSRAAEIRRRLEALPSGDGGIMVLVTFRGPKGTVGQRWELQSPQEIQDYCAEHMAKHDARNLRERYGGNQWGEGWVIQPEKRERIENYWKPVATDPSFEEFCACHEAPKSAMSKISSKPNTAPKPERPKRWFTGRSTKSD